MRKGQLFPAAMVDGSIIEFEPVDGGWVRLNWHQIATI
jgi:hypothetical protein